MICETITFEGRSDAAKHFFVSAALTAVAGPFLAERVGRDKELDDAHRLVRAKPSGQGFSFVDLAYNHAGIRYASWLLGYNDPRRLTRPPPPLERFLPAFASLDLPEGLDWDTFQERYYGKNWPRYRKIIDNIHAQIDSSLGDS